MTVIPGIETAFDDVDWRAPPPCGALMPDGRSRVVAVTIVEGFPTEIAFDLAGVRTWAVWPCTSRMAKRRRCKIIRRGLRRFEKHLVRRGVS